MDNLHAIMSAVRDYICIFNYKLYPDYTLTGTSKIYITNRNYFSGIFNRSENKILACVYDFVLVSFNYKLTIVVLSTK